MEMDIDYIVRTFPLPGGIKGFITKREDLSLIVINDNLADDAKLRTYRHELNHLINGDLDKEEEVGKIEGGRP